MKLILLDLGWELRWLPHFHLYSQSLQTFSSNVYIAWCWLHNHIEYNIWFEIPAQMGYTAAGRMTFSWQIAIYYKEEKVRYLCVISWLHAWRCWFLQGLQTNSLSSFLTILDLHSRQFSPAYPGAHAHDPSVGSHRAPLLQEQTCWQPSPKKPSGQAERK